MAKAVTTALALALVATAVALAGSRAPVATVRAGVGKMTVLPNRVTVATTNDFTFSFKADTSALVGQTTLDISPSWTPPQRSSPSGPGYVEVKHGSCAASTRLVSVRGRRLLMATSCKRGDRYQVIYHAAAAPTRASSEGYLFLTQTKPKGGRKAKFRPLGLKKQPIIRVRGGPTTALEIVSTSVATSGVPFSVTVRAIDRFGNNSTGYAATVTLKSTDPTATMPGPYAYGPADVSQHTFQRVTLRKPGTQRLTATDSNGLVEEGPPITVYARG
jgi:hypothetical protein